MKRGEWRWLLTKIQYLPPAISTFAVESNNTFRALQNFSFNYSSTNPEPQDKAHIHQALLDPTGQYILFPDLGADLIRVYCIEPKTNNLVAHESLKTKPKYGPRHAVFWSPEDSPTNVFLFVIHELSNKIVSYSVKYKETGGLEFCEVDEVSTFGNRNVTEEAAASEIVKVRFFLLHWHVVWSF
jgi:6-phosphogluconolactonase (cycloisomerase 2 family)